jgi:hypothetical protein
MEAGPAADLLGVKAANFGGAKRDDAVDRRLVEPLRPKHRVGNEPGFSASETFQHACPILAFAIDMLGSDSAFPAKLGEAFRKGAERKKRETLAPAKSLAMMSAIAARCGSSAWPTSSALKSPATV